jgi:hypothetical protein
MRVWMAIAIAACAIGGVIALTLVQVILVFEHGGRMPADHLWLIAQFLMLFLPASVAAGIALTIALWVVRAFRALLRWSRREDRPASS